MIVDVGKLSSGAKGDFSYSEEAELRLCELVYGKGMVEGVTQGYNADYDVLLTDGTKVEVKFTRSKDIFIEEAYYDGTPSGLSITKADVYLIVHKGYWDGDIGKIKEIPVNVLNAVRNKCRYKEYQPSRAGPGSKGFILGAELGNNDGWLGNVGMNEGVYDIGRYTWKNQRNRRK